ncbi:hypothetical protein ASE04_09635 [Rhizobium sp. Root708]|uniref:hypothetical protein n=1 Tax=Rhizobium sp. Root708 TaxID=1736592 RepID=UPI0006F39E19|nr:hypothetical protein [Rhizobium sp. Root708]KRB51785.1 hypothetical protein ASE04_09635 [Rhizobium sp. Root708]
MVNIPTSRDVGYAGTRSGRIAPNGPTPMVGAAIANAGQQVVQAAYNINDLRTQEQADVLNDKSNTVSTNLNKFLNEEEQSFLKAREGSSESGIGFTRQFMEGYQQRANDFAKANFEGLNEDAQTGYLNNILARGNSLFEKASAYENTVKGEYYDRSTKQSLDGIRTSIQSNGAPYEDLKKQGLAAIDATNMPEPWKAERRAQWDSDAAESKWKWEFSQNPKAALASISPNGGGSVVDRIIGIESGGNDNAQNPTSSAGGAGQFIDSTWLSMVKKYRPDVAEGKSAQDILAMKSDGSLSRDMTARYAQENSAFLQNQGVATTDGNVYLAHFLGPRGAAQVIKADPNAPIASVVGPDVVGANPFLNGKTAGDVRAWAEKKMGGAGTTPPSDYSKISYERRDQLYKQGEQDYAQEQTRQRTAIKDDFNLQIARNPQPQLESQILRNSTLDNGDKASLINALHTAVKENAGVPELISAIGAGKGSINAFDGEQTKVAEKAYDRMITGASGEDKQAITSGFIAQTGYIPKAVQAELRRGSISTDAAAVAQSMQAADVLQKNAPVSFSAMDGGAAVQKKLDLYRSYTRDMGYSADEAAKRLVDADNPEKAAQREALLKSKTVADAVKLVDSSTIAASFDDSIAGWRTNPSLGPTPAAEAAMVADYRSLYQEAIVDAGGDLTVAKKAADQRFQRTYGVTSFTPMGSNVVVKYPPEKVYPAAPDGTHTYIQTQLNEVMKAEGVSADQFFLQPDDITGQDVRAGKPPRYAVFYKKDGKLERFNLPFYADPEASQKFFQEQKEGRVRASQQRMTDNRDRTIEEGKAVTDAMNSTVGPAWMKARAAQTAQEKLRMQEMMPGPLNPSTAGVGGGGGGF